MRYHEFKNANHIKKVTKELIANHLGYESDKIILDASIIDDMGADSLDLVELVMAFEEEFSYEIPDESTYKMATVADIVDFFVHTCTYEDGTGDFTSSVLAFRLGADGKIAVGMQGTDGSWLFVDESKRLPSGIYIVTFNKWSDILKELEDIINTSNLKESYIQEFFEKHSDLLKGDDYDRVVPQAIIRPDTRMANWRADFVLHPHDQVRFSKIIELKPPSQTVFKRDKSGHSNFYSEVNSAIQQLRDYGRAFSSLSTRDHFRAAYGVDVFQPDLQLIVGRRWDVDHIDAMLERQRCDGVEIVDWDTTIDRLRRKFT